MNELVQKVFLDVIPVGSDALNGELRRDDTESWDSLAHLRLITALEAALGCTFSMDEIQSMDSYSAVVDMATAHAQETGRDG